MLGTSAFSARTEFSVTTAQGRGCTRQSSHPGPAKSQRYQGIESRGKEAVAGSEEEKEAEEVGITLSR